MSSKKENIVFSFFSFYNFNSWVIMMKKDTALKISKEWARVFTEYVCQITQDKNVTANLIFPICKIEKTWYCAFDLSVSNGFKRNGATKIPSIHGVVLANQILESLMEKFVMDEETIFSHIYSVKSMLESNFYGFTVQNTSSITIEFQGIYPDEEIAQKYTNFVTEREEKGLKRK